MISKELLSEVLDDKRIMMNKIEFEIGNSYLVVDNYIRINIYELAHKCKKWALNEGWWIDSNLGFINIGKNGNGIVWKTFNGYDLKLDEPNLIFKACKWILKETK